MLLHGRDTVKEQRTTASFQQLPLPGQKGEGGDECGVGGTGCTPIHILVLPEPEVKG